MGYIVLLLAVVALIYAFSRDIQRKKQRIEDLTDALQEAHKRLADGSRQETEEAPPELRTTSTPAEPWRVRFEDEPTSGERYLLLTFHWKPHDAFPEWRERRLPKHENTKDFRVYRAGRETVLCLTQEEVDRGIVARVTLEAFADGEHALLEDHVRDPIKPAPLSWYTDSAEFAARERECCLYAKNVICDDDMQSV